MFAGFLLAIQRALGCQFASRVPTVSFFHNAFCMKSLSSGGMTSLSHAFHTCIPCRGGSGVRDDKNLNLCLVFHSI